MRHYNVKPLQVLLKPSRQLLCMLLLSAFSALIILLCMPLYVWIKLAGGLAITLSATYFIARDALLVLPWSWHAIDLNARGELFLTSQDGVRRHAEVEGTSFVAAYMTLLNIKFNGSRWQRHVAILSDTADTQEFRKFRVWLRWGMPQEYEKLEHDEPVVGKS